MSLRSFANVVFGVMWAALWVLLGEDMLDTASADPALATAVVVAVAFMTWLGGMYAFNQIRARR